ncbi:MAG: 3-phosphoglycerate dehydrogenase [Vicinamibacterales bacterium]
MTAPRLRIQTLNNISAAGLARLDASRFETGAALTDPDAILLRSADLHATPIPHSVKAIGRAGSGTNNIPVADMTTRGVPVFNAPGANANAVKELVIAAMIIGARSLGAGWQFARTLEGDDASLHKAVEAGKKAYAGIEIAGRTLGVIGLGAIGGRVASAGVALGMRVVGFDPGLSVEGAWQLDPRVQSASALDDVFAAAQFLSIHAPLTPGTRGLVNAERLALMPKGGVLINFAREGVIDEAAVIQALDSGALRAYVSDFPTAATVAHPRCVTLPHLGASTAEAEDNCAVMVADQVRDFLVRGDISNSVNFPAYRAPGGFHHRLVYAGGTTGTAAMVGDMLAKAGVVVTAAGHAMRNDLTYGTVDTADALDPAVVEAVLAIPGVVMVRVIA